MVMGITLTLNKEATLVPMRLNQGFTFVAILLTRVTQRRNIGCRGFLRNFKVIHSEILVSSLHFLPLVPHSRRHFQGGKIVPYWIDCRYENFKGNSRNHTKKVMVFKKTDIN